MFGIGSTEFLVILLVALLVLGPKSLSKVTRTMGKYIGEFRRVSTEFQRTLNAEVAEEERQEKRDAVKKKADAARAARARQAAAKAEAAPAGENAPKAGTKPSQEEAPRAPEQDQTLAPPPPGSPLEAMLRKTAAESGPAPEPRAPGADGGQA